MMKPIIRYTFSFILIFIIGFAAGIGVSKYQHANYGYGNQKSADILSRK